MYIFILYQHARNQFLQPEIALQGKNHLKLKQLNLTCQPQYIIITVIIYVSLFSSLASLLRVLRLVSGKRGYPLPCTPPLKNPTMQPSARGALNEVRSDLGVPRIRGFLPGRISKNYSRLGPYRSPPPLHATPRLNPKP